MTKRIYKSDACEAAHSSAQALYRTGVIGKATMRHFDVACLSMPPSYAPEDIQWLREANKGPVLKPSATGINYGDRCGLHPEGAVSIRGLRTCDRNSHRNS